jgi:short-subunit dehydrogenase
VRSFQILTKYFYRRFKNKNRGYILNTGSSAGLMPAGPYMATYYATKAYVVSLTSALARELKEVGSKAYIGVLCPGPVNTEFNQNANVTFSLPGIEAGDCAEYAINMMFKRKVIIVPTITMKAAVFFGHILPRSLMTCLAGNQQKKKLYNERSKNENRT